MSRRLVWACFVVLGLGVHDGAAENQVINVTDHGAVPDSGGNATPALQASLRAARELDAPRVVFEPGRYDFAHDSTLAHGRFAALIRGIDNLTIDGQGAALFFEGRTAPLRFDNCRNLTIRNLSIDWAEPMFMQGEVIATDEARFDVRVDPAHPVVGGEPVEAYQDFDPTTRLPREQGIDQYDSVTHTEKLEEQVLRVHLHGWGAVPAVGDRVVLRNQVYAYNAFELHDCSDVTFEDITVHHTPGMGLYARGSHNVTLRRFNVRTPEGSDRLMSTNADATHFSGCTGMIRIDDCVFERMGDDAVNINSGVYLTIHEVENARTFTGAHNLGGPIHEPDVGDRMELFSQRTLLPIGDGEVVAVQRLPDNVYRVRFTEPTLENAAPGDVVGNATRVAQVHITNVRVRDNRARGFLIQTRGALIEDCIFENTTTAGIFVMTEISHFFEAVPASDIVVRNNRFENVGYGSPPAEGIIMVYAYLADQALPPEPGVIRDVVVEGNTIHGGNSSGIFVAGTENIALRDNTITGTCAAPHRTDTAGALYITSSRQVALENNTVRLEDQADACAAALLLGPGNELGTFEASGNIGFTLESAERR